MKRSGFTLFEAAISVAIVGVLMVASTGTFSAIARGRASQVERRRAYLLCQQLMTEITGKYFQTPGTTTFGPQGGQTRSTFSDVDQYDGYSASPPVDGAGNSLSGYTGWAESVAVVFVDPLAPASVVSTSTLKRVTVTVTSPSGKPYSLVGLRSSFGAYETVPTTQTNYVTGVSVTVQGASPAKTVYTGARPLNVTTSQ